MTEIVPTPNAGFALLAVERSSDQATIKLPTDTRFSEVIKSKACVLTVLQARL